MPRPLVQIAADTGFKAMSSDRMLRVMERSAVLLPERRPCWEKDVAYVLVPWALRGASETEAWAMVEQRKLRPPAKLALVVTEAHVANLAKDGITGEGEIL